METNNVKEVILLAALWILFFVCMSNELLSGIYKDLAFFLCIIATIVFIGLSKVIEIFDKFLNMVIQIFHFIFVLIISFFAVVQIISAIVSHLKIQVNTDPLLFLILVVWIVLLYFYFKLFKNQLCCDLMLSSVALPAIHVFLMDKYQQVSSSDSIYLIIWLLFFLCILLQRDAPETRVIHTIIFNSITFAATVGYYQRVVNNRSISYVLLFIIALLAQCLVHYKKIVALYKIIRDSLRTEPSDEDEIREQSHLSSKEEYIKKLRKELELEIDFEKKKNEKEKE